MKKKEKELKSVKILNDTLSHRHPLTLDHYDFRSETKKVDKKKKKEFRFERNMTTTVWTVKWFGGTFLF